MWPRITITKTTASQLCTNVAPARQESGKGTYQRRIEAGAEHHEPAADDERRIQLLSRVELSESWPWERLPAARGGIDESADPSHVVLIPAVDTTDVAT